MCSYHWRRNITLFKWYMWSIFICEMWMYLYEEQETCQNTYIYYICVFPPAAGETPDTWTTQTQLPWQRQTSQISVTSLQTQSLTQTVCASLMLKFIKKKNINFSAACRVKKTNRHFPSGKFSFSFNSNPLSVYFSSRRSRSPKRRRYVCFWLKSLKWSHL